MKLKFSSLPALLFCCLAASAAYELKANSSAETFFPGAALKNDPATTLPNTAATQASPGFFENRGQLKGYDGLAHPEVKFAMQQGATSMFLLQNGIAYQFTRTHYPQGYLELVKNRKSAENEEKIAALQQQIRMETFRMDMVLKGANANASISTEGKSTDFINYYNHNALDVHHYGKIVYHEVYPGIDWVIYTKNGAVKYDFVLQAGADPALIQLEFKHQESLALDASGSLSLGNRLGRISEQAPLSLQDGKEISTRFVLRENLVTFHIDHYNTARPLTIDPSLAWATYYGGTDTDRAYGCATDASGNVYIAGETISAQAIAAGGYQNTYGGAAVYDAFLAKFSASGARLWATYYGGTSDEHGFGCATDASGNVYLAGVVTASSAGFASGGHQNTIGGGFDAFLVKFNSAGVRQWATYYGGPTNDWGYGCTTDATGNVFLTGTASSTTGIASGGFQNTMGGGGDAFLVKFNSAGVRQWGTYFGGGLGDIGYSCVADPSGNVYMAGKTASQSNIGSGGFQNAYGGGFSDGYLVKFDGTGLLLWATYYGGSNTDFGQSCAVDANNNVYLAGFTSSSNNIAAGGHQNSYTPGPNNNASPDAFLVKFNSSGARQWGTYYGDAGDDVGWACLTDAMGNVYMAGSTTSVLNIASLGYQNQPGGGGLEDAFLVKFNTAGVRQWGTYYGGASDEEGNSLAIGSTGAMYLAGYTSSTQQIASQGFQNSLGSGPDGFLVKFCDDPVQPFAINGNTNVCSGTSQLYSVTNNTANASYSWTVPASWGGTPNNNSITATPNVSGNVSVYVTNACGAGLTQNLVVTVDPSPSLSINGNTTKTVICVGAFVSLNASGAASYTWNPGGVANALLVNPSVTTVYAVSGSTGNCTSTKSYTVTVDKCTGLAEQAAGNDVITVYPNPAAGLFTVECLNVGTLQVYDGLGRLVLQRSVQAQKETVDLSALEKGVYVLRLQDATGWHTARLISQ